MSIDGHGIFGTYQMDGELAAERAKLLIEIFSIFENNVDVDVEWLKFAVSDVNKAVIDNFCSEVTTAKLNLNETTVDIIEDKNYLNINDDELNFIIKIQNEAIIKASNNNFDGSDLDKAKKLWLNAKSRKVIGDRAATKSIIENRNVSKLLNKMELINGKLKCDISKNDYKPKNINECGFIELVVRQDDDEYILETINKISESRKEK